MKQVLFTMLCFPFLFFAQDKEKKDQLNLEEAKSYIQKANERVENDDFITAETLYRQAISKHSLVSGNYNLGNSYYKKGSFNEALYRYQQALKKAKTKTEKHKAYHNIGNLFMQNKDCKAAVESYKNALRNNPSDDETRYNLGIAQECEKQQEDDGGDDDKEKDKDKDKDKNKDQDKKDKEDKENKEDKEDPKDDKENGDKKEEPKDDKKKGEQNQQPKPRKQGQLSPQQIQSLLEAMNNQEQKVQEKMNKQKEKGIKIKTEKDW